MMYYSEFNFPPPPPTFFFFGRNLDLGDVRIAAFSINSHEQTQLFTNIVVTL